MSGDGRGSHTWILQEQREETIRPRNRNTVTAAKQLRLQLENTENVQRRPKLKAERNRILHNIRRKAQDLLEAELDKRAEEIEQYKDGAKLFNAVHLMKRKTYVRPTVTDATGKIICNGQEASVAVSNHFVSQFTGGISEGFPAHAGPPRPLSTPISPTEVELAL